LENPASAVWLGYQYFEIVPIMVVLLKNPASMSQGYFLYSVEKFRLSITGIFGIFGEIVPTVGAFQYTAFRTISIWENISRLLQTCPVRSTEIQEPHHLDAAPFPAPSNTFLCGSVTCSSGPGSDPTIKNVNIL
jgi:hypothetical protein